MLWETIESRGTVNLISGFRACGIRLNLGRQTVSIKFVIRIVVTASFHCTFTIISKAVGHKQLVAGMQSDSVGTQM